MPRRKTLRQFRCEDCGKYWWARVPRNDPFSDCFKCKVEFEALPPEQESGWAKFECDCGNDFSGFATLMNPADSPCYVCGDSCAPVRVVRHPDQDRRSTSDNVHSCTGVNCYNRVKGIPARGECVHPKSPRCRQEVIYRRTQ